MLSVAAFFHVFVGGCGSCGSILCSTDVLAFIILLLIEVIQTDVADMDCKDDRLSAGDVGIVGVVVDAWMDLCLLSYMVGEGGGNGCGHGVLDGGVLTIIVYKE